MGKIVGTKYVELATQLVELGGAGEKLTESAKLSPENIEGMPASLAMVSAAEKLDNVLKEFQSLVQRDQEQMKKIALDIIAADRKGSGK